MVKKERSWYKEVDERVGNIGERKKVSECPLEKCGTMK